VDLSDLTKRKIIVLYSSGYGTTKEVSEEIAKIIARETLFDVKSEAIDNVCDIEQYSALIIGTSVRADKPLANVRDFIAVHHAELLAKELAFFIVCLTANSPRGRRKVLDEYIPQLTADYNHIQPISVAAFGGKIDFDKLNPVMQSLIQHVYAKTGIESTGSVDVRDWAMIRSWAVDLQKKLKQALIF